MIVRAVLLGLLLIPSARAVLAPAWSPDGRTIALVSRVPRESPPLFRMPEKPASANWAAPAEVISDFPYRRAQRDRTEGDREIYR